MQSVGKLGFSRSKTGLNPAASAFYVVALFSVVSSFEHNSFTGENISALFKSTPPPPPGRLHTGAYVSGRFKGLFTAHELNRTPVRELHREQPHLNTCAQCSKVTGTPTVLVSLPGASERFRKWGGTNLYEPYTIL